jgi:hypothetical protein
MPRGISCRLWNVRCRRIARGQSKPLKRLCLDVLELAPDRAGALSVLYDIRKS